MEAALIWDGGTVVLGGRRGRVVWAWEGKEASVLRRAVPGTRAAGRQGAMALLPAELLGPAGGSFHSTHGSCSQPALLQGMEPIDGGASWCKHIRP